MTAATVTHCRIYTDTHVHLYPRFDVSSFFDSAYRKYADGMWADESGLEVIGCLMLAETARDDAFAMLQNYQDDGGGWSFHLCRDGVSLWARRGNDRLLVIAGRQIVTAERLEILALGTRGRFDDGQAIEVTIRAAIDADAQAVLPYGLGKWTGKRADLATQAFYDWHQKGLRLGDNAGRPRGLPDNGLFNCARKIDSAILPGSDPLNIPSGVRCAGSYGIILDVELDPDAPAASVKNAMQTLPGNPSIFGKRVSMPGCVQQQVSLRWHKRIDRNRNL